jgi:hypothetical protein
VFRVNRIAGKALRISKPHLNTVLLEIRTKMELSQSRLQQSNLLTVISFKLQLNDLG